MTQPITLREEGFDQLDADGQIRVLARAQWDELERHAELRPFDIDWEGYRRMSAAGLIYFLAARDGEKLVGFSSYFLTRGMRGPSSALIAFSDMWHVLKPYRVGLLAARMLRAAEHDLRDRGARMVLHCDPHHQSLEAFFVRMGYRPIETILEKKL